MRSTNFGTNRPWPELPASWRPSLRHRGPSTCLGTLQPLTSPALERHHVPGTYGAYGETPNQIAMMNNTAINSRSHSSYPPDGHFKLMTQLPLYRTLCDCPVAHVLNVLLLDASNRPSSVFGRNSALVHHSVRSPSALMISATPCSSGDMPSMCPFIPRNDDEHETRTQNDYATRPRRRPRARERGRPRPRKRLRGQAQRHKGCHAIRIFLKYLNISRIFRSAADAPDSVVGGHASRLIPHSTALIDFPSRH